MTIHDPMYDHRKGYHIDWPYKPHGFPFDDQVGSYWLWGTLLGDYAMGPWCSYKPPSRQAGAPIGSLPCRCLEMRCRVI